MFTGFHIWQGEALAAIDNKGGRVSYGELEEFSGKFFNVIRQRALLFILCNNSVGSLAGYAASISNRIVPLLLSTKIDRSLLENLLETYRPSYIWIPEDYSENFTGRRVLSGFNHVLLKTENPCYEINPELSFLLTTSGSTGSPKLVRHSYKNLEASARNVSAFFNLDNSDRPAAILPMNYTMGLSVINSHLYSGATILLYDGSLTDKAFWDYIKDERATSFTGVPYSYEILNRLRFFRMDLPDLRLITQGGGKMRDELFRKCAEYALDTGKRFIATYGQTEGTARMSFLEPGMAIIKTGSIGKAIPEGRFMLTDENGAIINEPEATGQLLYEGPNVTLGYAFNGDDLKKGDNNSGVLITGDIARRDKEGFYYIVGRLNRFLKLYGNRISLDEVELLIKSNFNIDCYSAGDDDLMKIYVEEALVKDDVHNFLVEKTGLFHGAIEVNVLEKIPRNETGKICSSFIVKM